MARGWRRRLGVLRALLTCLILAVCTPAGAVVSPARAESIVLVAPAARAAARRVAARPVAYAAVRSIAAFASLSPAREPRPAPRGTAPPRARRVFLSNCAFLC